VVVRHGIQSKVVIGYYFPWQGDGKNQLMQDDNKGWKKKKGWKKRKDGRKDEGKKGWEGHVVVLTGMQRN
jgi:hypothetical protein